MEHKNNLLIFGVIALLVVAVIVAVVATNRQQAKNPAPAVSGEQSPEVILNIAEVIEVNSGLNEVTGIEEINLERELSKDELDVVSSDLYTIPLTLEDVEIMSEEEKLSMGIESDLPIQVLGRTEDGRPAGYRFLQDANSILIDNR